MEVMKIELNKAIEYIDKAQAKLSEWRSKVALGNRYYNNEDDIKRTGAAAIDAVNGYFYRVLGKTLCARQITAFPPTGMKF